MLKIRLFPILVLFLGLILTFVISYSAMQDMKEIGEHEFEKVCRDFENKIQIQLKANAQILYSSAAFISSSDTISREEWREFQYLNKSYTELPGIQGIGYSVIVPKNQITQFEQEVRQEGFPEFKVNPGGERDFYTSVLYIEPFSGRNLIVLGYDGYTEPVRRKAMMMACDQDRGTISGKVVLLQESKEDIQPGTIMFVPVFKHGMPKESPAEKKSAILGWVFSPFRMSDLLSGILGQWDYHTVRLKVYDDLALNPEKLLFDSDSVFQIQHTVRPPMHFRIPLNFNDHVWMLDFSKYKNESGIFSLRFFTVLTEGIIISILLFVLAVNLINARTKSLQIQVLNEELKKANISKDRFISVLAHDLKSPFNALLGFSELLTDNFDDFDDATKAQYAGQIHSLAQVTFHMLEELLLWAMVQSGQFPFKPEKLNLNDLCKQLVSDHELIAGKKSITISMDVQEEVFVMADEMMLKTILRNLIVNAIKFTRSYGSISIGILITDGKAIISVSDTGIGISPADRDKLFDISYVHSKSGTASEKGTGLGLLLCKDMVVKHGGEIWVESALGFGSTFSFSIPLA